MKYIYTIDKYNSISIDNDDVITSQTDMFEFLKSIGLVVYHKDGDDTGKCRMARRELGKVFHARNFHMWEHMREERGLI